MATVQKGEFVTVEYIGKIKDSGKIFDLTNEDVAKQLGMFNTQSNFGARTICVGENQILKGIDKILPGKEIGKPFAVEVAPNEAFGSKDSKLLKVMATQELLKQKIQPFPGLQINASGLLGTVRSVNIGRTTVDFNHPLAGKTLLYEVTITKKVDDPQEKLDGLVKNIINVRKEEYSIKNEDKKYTLTFKNGVAFPQMFKDDFVKKVKKFIPEIECTFA